MNYSLGNMLGGAGALNPDKLALNLQFATDKTLTARRGPTPTFTRASAATYYGPLVNYNSVTGFSTTGISNGRASWFKSESGEDITISYNGTRWQVIAISGESTFEYLAAAGSEWRPDQANWTGSGGFPVTTSSNYGVVRAGTNEPRFDHNNASPFASKGLLIEESRTNLMLQSQNFASATWSKNGGSISSVTNTAPNGSTTSELFSEDSTTGTHRVFQTLSSTSGTVYSFSVFLKYAGRQQVFLETRAIGTNPFAVFNIQDGTIVTVSSGLTASIQAFPNGWYKCSIVGTATITSAGTNYLIGGYSGGSQSYTGLNGAAFYIYGSQVEAGAFPTSYIPTTTASVVRSADICSISGANFTSFYNQSEGTVYTESRPATVNGTTTTFGLSNGTANERWLNRFAQGEQVVITSAGVEANLDALNPVAGTLYKVATAAKLNDIAMSINGLAVVTDTSQPMPVVDRAGIGNSTGTNTAGAVTIASIRYYKKRLANAKLQALTA